MDAIIGSLILVLVLAGAWLLGVLDVTREAQPAKRPRHVLGASSEDAAL